MRKNILSFILCMIITACAMTACGHDKGTGNKSEEVDNYSVSTGNDDNSLSEVSIGEFAWNVVKKDITFDGKKIDFPFSVNDLGEGYKMSYIYDSAFGDKICDGEVVRINSDGSESMACFLSFDGLTADEYTDDTKCTRISVTEDLIVQGIGKGSSLEDAEKLWGKPYKKDDIFAFFLSKSGTERIELKYDTETDKVKSVYITLNFKEEE